MTRDAAAERVRLEIGGMTCASCAARIERKLNKLDGVEATVNYATEEAAVSHDPVRVDADALIRTVEATGYTAAFPRAALDADQAGESETRTLRTRLVVGARLFAPPLVPLPVPARDLGGSGGSGAALSA